MNALIDHHIGERLNKEEIKGIIMRLMSNNKCREKVLTLKLRKSLHFEKDILTRDHAFDKSVVTCLQSYDLVLRFVRDRVRPLAAWADHCCGWKWRPPIHYPILLLERSSKPLSVKNINLDSWKNSSVRTCSHMQKYSQTFLEEDTHRKSDVSCSYPLTPSLKQRLA